MRLRFCGLTVYNERVLCSKAVPDDSLDDLLSALNGYFRKENLDTACLTPCMLHLTLARLRSSEYRKHRELIDLFCSASRFEVNIELPSLVLRKTGADALYDEDIMNIECG